MNIITNSIAYMVHSIVIHAIRDDGVMKPATDAITR
jgi:hypothetical protein